MISAWASWRTSRPHGDSFRHHVQSRHKAFSLKILSKQEVLCNVADPRSGIRCYFDPGRPWKQFFGLKILTVNFLVRIRIRDPKSFWSGMEKFGSGSSSLFFLTKCHYWYISVSVPLWIMIRYRTERSGTVPGTCFLGLRFLAFSRFWIRNVKKPNQNSNMKQKNSTVSCQGSDKPRFFASHAKIEPCSQTDIAVSQSVLSSLRGRGARPCPSLLWVYGPNPLFLGTPRALELDQSLRNQFVVAMQQKLDISQIHAEINLVTARHLGKDWISSLVGWVFIKAFCSETRRMQCNGSAWTDIFFLLDPNLRLADPGASVSTLLKKENSTISTKAFLKPRKFEN